MHHHVRSVASRRISTALRQRLLHPPIPRPRSAAPFHSSAPQFLPHPTQIRRRDDQNDGSSTRQGFTPPTPQEAWAEETIAQVEAEPFSLEDAAASAPAASAEEAPAPAPATADTATSAAAESFSSATPPLSEFTGQPPDQPEPAVEEPDVDMFEPTSSGFHPPTGPQKGVTQGFARLSRKEMPSQKPVFLPETVTNKEEVWELLRNDPYLKVRPEMWATWGIEDRWKYKMIRAYKLYNEQEGMTENQKALEAIIGDKRRGDFIIEGASLDRDAEGTNDFPVALAFMIARRLSKDRMDGKKGTGALIICHSAEYAKGISALSQPLANCYDIRTCMTKPLNSEEPNGDPKPLITYEEVVSRLEDVNCHVLAITNREFQKLVMNDPDARRLLNLVDWQTVVINDVANMTEDHFSREYLTFNRMVPPWRTRQLIFVENYPSTKTKLTINLMAKKAVKTVCLGSRSIEDEVRLAAEKIPQSLLVLPSEDPQHLMPNLVALVLRERGMHPQRLKAIVCLPTPLESRFVESYFRHVQVEPALPQIFSGGLDSKIRRFREADEGILFMFDAVLASKVKQLDDLTHIFHVNPLDGGEYVRVLNRADLSGGENVKSIPKAITVTFPFEYATFARQPEVQAQQLLAEQPPSEEDLAWTGQLDATIRAKAAEEGNELVSVNYIYEQWLRRMAPYMSFWELKPEDLVQRANHLAQHLWGATTQPTMRATHAEMLNFPPDLPGLLVHDNLQQWRNEEKFKERNMIQHRARHWRGKKLADLKHRPPILDVKRLDEKPSLFPRRRGWFGPTGQQQGGASAQL